MYIVVLQNSICTVWYTSLGNVHTLNSITDSGHSTKGDAHLLKVIGEATAVYQIELKLLVLTVLDSSLCRCDEG